jgi:hypothetical protein
VGEHTESWCCQCPKCRTPSRGVVMSANTRPQRLLSWLTLRALGWTSPSLGLMGCRQTLRWVWTGDMADADWRQP